MNRYIEIGIADMDLHTGQWVGTCGYLAHRKVGQVGETCPVPVIRASGRPAKEHVDDGVVIWGRMGEDVDPDARLALDTKTGEVFGARGKLDVVDPELVGLIAVLAHGYGIPPATKRPLYWNSPHEGWRWARAEMKRGLFLHCIVQGVFEGD